MKIRSITIIGITGGIGIALYEKLKGSTMKIHGCYFSNEKIANKLRDDNNVSLQKIDLSIQGSIEEIKLPNFESIIYLAGIPHFSNDVFEFNNEELKKQVNLNIYSLLYCLKQITNINNSSLRKIIIITSLESKKLQSIYHLFKFLQEEMLKKLVSIYSDKEVSISIIRTDWVNTNMYKQYKSICKIKNDKVNKKEAFVVMPQEVADVCLKELNNFSPYSEYVILKKTLQ